MNKLHFISIIVSVFILTSCMKKKDCVCTELSGSEHVSASIKTNSSSKIRKFENDCKLKEVDYYENGAYIGRTQCVVK